MIHEDMSYGPDVSLGGACPRDRDCRLRYQSRGIRPARRRQHRQFRGTRDINLRAARANRATAQEIETSKSRRPDGESGPRLSWLRDWFSRRLRRMQARLDDRGFSVPDAVPSTSVPHASSRPGALGEPLVAGVRMRSSDPSSDTVEADSLTPASVPPLCPPSCSIVATASGFSDSSLWLDREQLQHQHERLTAQPAEFRHLPRLPVRPVDGKPILPRA